MLALAGRVYQLGIAFPSKGRLWNLLSELSLFSGSLFHSAAWFRATARPGTRRGLKEQRVEVWGHAALQLPGAPRKLSPPHMAFAVWDGNFTKLSCTGQVPRNIRTLKCLYLIMGSGTTYLDRFDCTTTERQQQIIMWLDSMDPNWSQSRAVKAWPRTAHELTPHCCQLHTQPRTLSWLTDTLMLPRAFCVIFQAKGVVALIHFFWMMIYKKGFWDSRKDFGQLNSPDLVDDRSQMWLKKTTGDTSPIFNLLSICLITAMESSNRIATKSWSRKPMGKQDRMCATQGKSAHDLHRPTGASIH